MLSAAALLAEWIDNRGYKNQRDAAKPLGISEGFLSMLLSGTRAPGRDRAVHIQMLTGIPVSAWTVKSKPQSRKARRPKTRKQPETSDLQGVMANAR